MLEICKTKTKDTTKDRKKRGNGSVIRAEEERKQLYEENRRRMLNTSGVIDTSIVQKARPARKRKKRGKGKTEERLKL